jgi:phosphoglycolate phosphatase
MTLTDILSRTRCLLLDFDGPICSVFAGHPASAIAAQLQGLIRDRLGTVPTRIAELRSDPLNILRQVADLDDDELTRAIADACRDAEVAAVASATPTPGTLNLLRAGNEMGMSVVIVSNNASQAVQTYLDRHCIAEYTNDIAARTDGMDPRLLKPHRYLLDAGLALTGTHAADAVFIGDSESDIEAGRTVGVATIGYANKPGKHQRLAQAGADKVIDSMQVLTDAIQLMTTRHAT